MSFDIKFSPSYLVMLVSVHLFALIAVASTNIPLWIGVALWIIVLVSLFYQGYRYTRGMEFWKNVQLDKKQLTLTDRRGDEWDAVLLQQTVVTPICIVLCVKIEERKLCQLIFPDAMQVDAFRAFRVRLKFY